MLMVLNGLEILAILGMAAIVLLTRGHLKAYLRQKGENLATKEDVADITRRVESVRATFAQQAEDHAQQNRVLLEGVRPLTAEATLRRENFLNSKLEAYLAGLSMVCQKFAASSIVVSGGQPRPASAEKTSPTETDINVAYGRMSLFAGNSAVLNQYQKIFQQKASPADIGELIRLMRDDLGYGQSMIPPERFPYVFGPERRPPTTP
jgi:hypothetical protein